ncbi:MAG: inositol monophosphatase family protein, partial [Chitinophagaceae bacterium]
MSSQLAGSTFCCIAPFVPAQLLQVRLGTVHPRTTQPVPPDTTANYPLFLPMLKNVLLQSVLAGGREMQRFMNTDYTTSNKEGINNLVTEADHASEKVIMDLIRASFPGHYILSEEIGEVIQDSNYKWIIDPIDGTVNFAHGIPICCVSIGIEKDGKMLMGAVYNPFMNELYFAERGEGAT